MRQWLSGSALALSFAIVMLATMWPTPLDAGFAGSIDKLLGVLHRNGVPHWFGYNKLEFSANILMFVPLGFLLAMLLSARVWWLALLICPAISICIELTQAAALAARFATTTDVASNSTGALIGVIGAVIVRAMSHRRDQKLIARVLWEHGIRTR